MKINVTENKVSIKEEQILNENEYNIHKIQFDFSSEYIDDLVKVALFSIDNHTYKKIISNNECDIPPEVLTKRGYSILGVYAYKTEQDTLVLRYSPSPTRISVYDGSYKAEAENSEPITPSEIEQYQQILQNSLQQFQNQYNVLVEEAEGDIQAIENELQRKVDEGYFDGEDGYTPQKGIDYFTEQDIEEIENGVKNDLQETVLINYSLIAETGSKIELSINTTNYKLTAILKDKNNATICTSNEIDLPLETMVVSASYDNTTKEIILTLQNGNTVRFSVADLVSGLVSEAQLQTILANYYTKTEENALLGNKVDKVQGKGLSTNDFTDEYKEQVDTNTEDIEDIQEEQTEQNTEIGNLQVENERLRNTLPTITGTGQAITLNKTAELEFKKPPLPMGNSEQVQYSGKNLFDEKNATVLYSNSNSTIQYINNSIKVIAGLNNGACFVTTTICNVDDLNDRTITVKGNWQGTNSGKIILGYCDTDGTNRVTLSTSIETSGNFATVTVPSNIEDKLLILWLYTGGNANGYVNYSNVQVEYGSTATSYEPYVGGTASPNPDYPQEITNVTGDVEVVVSNADNTKSQTFTFPLGNEKLMLGDYLADDGIHHVRRQATESGTAITLNDAKNNGAYLCNKKTSGNLAGKTLTFDEAITDALIEYELEEEVIIPYTLAQQTAYNAIKQAISYEGQTNISSNQNAIFNVEAYLDTKVILSEKGTYSKPSTGIPKTDLSNAVQTSLGKADTAIQDISGKQDITDNTLTTINKTVPTAINEVNSIAKGANQALSYGNYQTMITAFNSLANNVYNVGQNVMIITLEVPDLWISGIESTSVPYTYTTDEAFTTALAINGYVQVGYYKLSALETQKVDLTNYVTNTDYVESGKAGIIRLSSGLGASNGYIYLTVYSYENYNNATNGLFIGKGTLENVITGKNLETGNNKVTTISSSSTNAQYPSAKAVYDYIQSLDGDEVSY